MRRIHLLAALALSALGACGVFQPASGTAAVGGTGAGGASVDCSTAGTCGDCEACATAMNGPCFAVFSACETDADCSAIDQCVALGDTVADCEANNPNGMSAYQAAANCEYCQACPSACPGMCM
jgi:hypothetical protein